MGDEDGLGPGMHRGYADGQSSTLSRSQGEGSLELSRHRDDAEQSASRSQLEDLGSSPDHEATGFAASVSSLKQPRLAYEDEDRMKAVDKHGLEFLLPEAVVRDKTSQEGSYVLEPSASLRELIVAM